MNVNNSTAVSTPPIQLNNNSTKNLIVNNNNSTKEIKPSNLTNKQLSGQHSSINQSNHSPSHLNSSTASSHSNRLLHNSSQMAPLNYQLNATLAWMSSARGKPRRGMMRRAVFSDAQRQGLEKRFQVQKYISKPDRKKLADDLGLKDSQVKIWFQNR